MKTRHLRLLMLWLLVTWWAVPCFVLILLPFTALLEFIALGHINDLKEPARWALAGLLGRHIR